MYSKKPPLQYSITTDQILRFSVVIVLAIITCAGVFFHLFEIDFITHLPTRSLCPFHALTGLECPRLWHDACNDKYRPAQTRRCSWLQFVFDATIMFNGPLRVAGEVPFLSATSGSGHIHVRYGHSGLADAFIRYPNHLTSNLAINLSDESIRLHRFFPQYVYKMLNMFDQHPFQDCGIALFHCLDNVLLTPSKHCQIIV